MNAREFIHKLMSSSKPIFVSFPIRYKMCAPSCQGYHPRPGLLYKPGEGFFVVPSPYGYHSLVYPVPKPYPCSAEEAERLAQEWLARARQTNPFLSYSDILDSAE